MQARLVLPLVTMISLFSAACRKESSAETAAVETANTSIKSQGQIAFCWAYAAVAMIESRYKVRTGKDIDLSEEALGFFHIAEKLQNVMDFKLQTGQMDAVLFVHPDTGKPVTIADGVLEYGHINKGMGSKGAFELVKRWGLIPESRWQVKFDDGAELMIKNFELEEKFLDLLKNISGKQRTVQANQIFKVLQSSVFPSIPPVDSFDNGSGMMNAVQYAERVIKFDPSDFYDVKVQSVQQLAEVLKQTKESLAKGLVVGLGIAMPDEKENRIVGTRFVGYGRAMKLDGGHAMVITDFKNKGGSFGRAEDVQKEVSKPIEQDFQLRLKNSWGSRSGVNEFGKKVQTGYYDMDYLYLEDVIKSGGHVNFTFSK
ncbi:MAG: hypothetical protein EBR09_05445 [Proteobacteria bacterium]|nr:hypothetical protein [Pseudomonadota bacterium]